MESITIRITEYSEGGYYYDIWPSDVVETDTESEDGGLCTTTILNALGMAVQQAEKLIHDDEESLDTVCDRTDEHAHS